MKCIYCEANETQGVLLCYSCQVDLFPLVSAWAYCGACGNEMPADRAICPQCVPTGMMPAPAAAPAGVSSATAVVPASSELSRDAVPPPKNKASTSSPSGPVPRSKEPAVTRTEIRQARRLQWIIKSIFAIFWLLIVILALWWVRAGATPPPDVIFP